MALFDFIKDVGETVKAEANRQETEAAQAAANEAASEAAEQAAELEAAVNEENVMMTEALYGLLKDYELASDDIAVMFDAGTVTLTGTVPSGEEREKLIIALGNVYGVEHVDDQLVIDAPDTPEPTMYTVKKGDTLWNIAKAHYGKGNLYKGIFEANRPMLKDANKIYPGQMLRIPAVETLTS